MKRFLLVLLSVALNTTLTAQEAPLSAPFGHQHGVTEDRQTKNLSPQTNFSAMLELQTPVRDQGARGTCSIFSALGIVESLLIREGLANQDLNLSEQWLSYVTQAYRNSAEEGSWSTYNWFLLKRYGLSFEETLPYNMRPLTQAESGLGFERCGHLESESNRQKVCLAAQYDPQYLNSTMASNDQEFDQARTEASELYTSLVRPFFRPISAPFSAEYRVRSLSNIRGLLAQGIPLALELDVFYGAWNHPAATSFGVERDLDHWAKGIVSHAEMGSLDRVESMKNRAGHAVILVGYDDNKIIQRTMKMTNGEERTFTYRGVYYFKNSWGTTSFGRDFEAQGELAPGYGMITYTYAHEKGSFFALPFRPQ